MSSNDSQEQNTNPFRRGPNARPQTPTTQPPPSPTEILLARLAPHLTLSTQPTPPTSLPGTPPNRSPTPTSAPPAPRALPDSHFRRASDRASPSTPRGRNLLATIRGGLSLDPATPFPVIRRFLERNPSVIGHLTRRTSAHPDHRHVDEEPPAAPGGRGGSSSSSSSSLSLSLSLSRRAPPKDEAAAVTPREPLLGSDCADDAAILFRAISDLEWSSSKLDRLITLGWTEERDRERPARLRIWKNTTLLPSKERRSHSRSRSRRRLRSNSSASQRSGLSREVSSGDA